MSTVQFDTFSNSFVSGTSAVNYNPNPWIIHNLSNQVVVAVVLLNPTASNFVVTSLSGMATWVGTAALTRQSGTSARVEVWLGTNPTPGNQANNVTVNFSGSVPNGALYMGVFYNVDQPTPYINGTVNGAVNSGPSTITISSGLNRIAVVGDMGVAGNANGTGTGYIELYNTNDGVANYAFGYFVGQPTSSATWTLFAGTAWVAAGLDLQPDQGQQGYGAALQDDYTWGGGDDN